MYWLSIQKHISASNKAKLAKYNYFAIFPYFWQCIWWHAAILSAWWYQYIFLLIEIMKGANTSVIPWFSFFPNDFPLWVYNAISSRLGEAGDRWATNYITACKSKGFDMNRFKLFLLIEIGHIHKRAVSLVFYLYLSLH